MLTWVSKAEVKILRSNESARGEAVIGWTKQARERNFTEFPRKKIEEHIDEAESPAERLAAGGGARARRVHENTVKSGDEKVQMATEDIGQGLERFVQETPEEASFVWLSGLSPNDDNDFLVKTVEGCLEDLAIHHLVGAPTAVISDPRNWHHIDPNNERQLLWLPLSEAIQFKGVDYEGRNRPSYSISMSRANRKIVSPKGKVTELGKSLICAQPGPCVAENLGNRVLGIFRPLAVQESIMRMQIKHLKEYVQDKLQSLGNSRPAMRMPSVRLIAHPVGFQVSSPIGKWHTAICAIIIANPDGVYPDETLHEM
jgi:hypothetical protein